MQKTLGSMFSTTETKSLSGIQDSLKNSSPLDKIYSLNMQILSWNLSTSHKDLQITKSLTFLKINEENRKLLDKNQVKLLYEWTTASLGSTNEAIDAVQFYNTRAPEA